MEASLNTQDLRAPAHDFKRATDNRRKWEHGEEQTRGRGTAHARPSKNRFAIKREEKHPKEWSLAQKQASLKQDTRLDAAEATDSSADEAVDSAPFNELDADVIYSFDAQRGPNHGSQVLGYALTKAVEQFESKTTDKLINEEYLVLDHEGEPVLGKNTKNVPKVNRAPIVLDEDEDYEIVD